MSLAGLECAMGRRAMGATDRPATSGAHRPAIDSGNAPLFVLPRLEVRFFRTRRTVSSASRSTCCHSTSRSARSWVVQQVRPAGGSVQARATRYASCLPSRRRGPRRRARSLNARETPPSTKCWRARWTVERPTCNDRAISSSVASSSARRRTWARTILRADAFPDQVEEHGALLLRHLNDILVGHVPSQREYQTTYQANTCQNSCGHPLN